MKENKSGIVRKPLYNKIEIREEGGKILEESHASSVATDRVSKTTIRVLITSKTL